jgi:hypothetical protein
VLHHQGTHSEHLVSAAIAFVDLRRSRPQPPTARRALAVDGFTRSKGPECNRDHTGVVLSTKVWLEWFRPAYERQCFGKGAAKFVKAAIQIDIIHHRYASGCQGRPSMVQLEHQVPPGVPAVVDEQVDRSDFGQEWTELASTRAGYIRPP